MSDNKKATVKGQHAELELVDMLATHLTHGAELSQGFIKATSSLRPSHDQDKADCTDYFAYMLTALGQYRHGFKINPIPAPTPEFPGEEALRAQIYYINMPRESIPDSMPLPKGLAPTKAESVLEQMDIINVLLFENFKERSQRNIAELSINNSGFMVAYETVTAALRDLRAAIDGEQDFVIKGRQLAKDKSPKVAPAPARPVLFHGDSFLIRNAPRTIQ